MNCKLIFMSILISTFNKQTVKIFHHFTDSQKKNEANKIQAAWSDYKHWPSKAEVKRAALLAWEGHLTTVNDMRIEDMDISDIPLAQMEKLTAIVTVGVEIINLTPTSQLSSILACVKCTVLWLSDMQLSEENTRALVIAMRDRVERVGLGDMDITLLTKYDGRTRCRELWVEGDTRTRHGDRLRSWAANVGWTVTVDTEKWLVTQRAKRKRQGWIHGMGEPLNLPPKRIILDLSSSS